jgi:hypothetical protein
MSFLPYTKIRKTYVYRPVHKTINDSVDLTTLDLSRYRYAPAIQDQTVRLQSLSISRTAPVLMLSRMSDPVEQRMTCSVATQISLSVLEQASRSVVKGTSFPIVNRATSLTAKGSPFLITKRTHPNIIIPVRGRIHHQQPDIFSKSLSQDNSGASPQSMPPLIAEMTQDCTDSQQRVDNKEKKKQRREHRAKVHSVCSMQGPD